MQTAQTEMPLVKDGMRWFEVVFATTRRMPDGRTLVVGIVPTEEIRRDGWAFFKGPLDPEVCRMLADEFGGEDD